MILHSRPEIATAFPELRMIAVRLHGRRIGRIVMARGRDAADVAMISSFGPHDLVHFQVWTDEVAETEAVPRLSVRRPVPVQIPAPVAGPTAMAG